MRHPIARALCLLSAAAWLSSSAGAQSDSAAAHHQRGVEHHLRRALDEASREYARALAMEPARDATPEELRVAYHLFWDDDIDFPEDNDPCDHEVLWVQFAADRQTLERVWTYFHGHILEGSEPALQDARQHDMRPRVDVQWGKHGTMPVGWESMSIRVAGGDAELPGASGERQVTLTEYNQGTFRRLSTDGRRLPAHPLGTRLGWPVRFTGAWSDFASFTRVVDPRPRLGDTAMVKVSRWNSATINQHFLTYNFRPKTEWPIDVPGPTAGTKAPAPLVAAASPDAFQLPAKTVFDKAMPRYPNAWFYVDRTLAPSYRAAVALVTDHVREPRDLRPLTHAHAFHMRYYFSDLEARKLEVVTLPTTSGPREFYRVAASAHYEVEHANPHHADVELCPICGRTGEYQDLKGSLVEQVHDPLGLELLLTGTNRGAVVRFDDYEQRPVEGILAPTDRLTFEHVVFPAQNGDRNTLRIGIILVTPPRGR